ncbi:MAG: type II toxin-antitoxin system YafQ family toxin [Gammaproteobacteria bacterium]|nr:type II toxin-antitoxin system YafQ family toxin [Gammaproteobacteria bacterium]
MRLLTTKRFERDLRRVRRRGKDPDRLWAVVESLLDERPLPARNRLHRLTGDWSGAWECHIEADWLLIWRRDEDSLTLVRTGTHSDLFG